nr:MAG TPA: EGF family domain-containing protein, invasion, moving junction, parasite [Caudoviricetes sp.]
MDYPIGLCLDSPKGKTLNFPVSKLYLCKVKTN